MANSYSKKGPAAREVPADYQMLSSEECEQILLGELLVEPTAIRDVAPYLKPEMFSEGSARDLWNEMLKQSISGKTPDMSTLYPIVDKEYIVSIITRGETAGMSFLNVMNHALYLRALNVKQRAFHYAHELLKAACSESSTEDELVGIVEKFLSESRNQSAFSGVQDMATLGNELGDELQSGTTKCVRTGIPKLDKFFGGGLLPGTLTIMAGRPGTGKTSMGCFIMRIGAQFGARAMMFCLEQTNLEIYKKLMLGTGHVTPEQFSSGQVDWQEYEAGVCELTKLPILLDDASRTVEEISYRIASYHRNGKCDIAFIDYLGLIPARPVNGMTKSQAIGEITHALKNLAKSLKMPIVLLCQLNRDMAKENRPPMLTDLRDSGDIEQDADKVIMIHRVENMTDHIEVNLWIRKNRQGKAGNVMVRLHPDEAYVNFYEVIQ